MAYPHWITTPAGKAIIVNSPEQEALEMAVDDDGAPIATVPIVVAEDAGEPEADSEPIAKPEVRNSFVNDSSMSDSRMFKRGPGRPKGSGKK